MIRRVLLLMVLVAEVACSCSPKVRVSSMQTNVLPRPSGGRVDFYPEGSAITKPYHVIGDADVGAPFFELPSYCDEWRVKTVLAEQACRVGADAVQLYATKKPGFWSQCFRTRARFLVYEKQQEIPTVPIRPDEHPPATPPPPPLPPRPTGTLRVNFIGESGVACRIVGEAPREWLWASPTTTLRLAPDTQLFVFKTLSGDSATAIVTATMRTPDESVNLTEMTSDLIRRARLGEVVRLTKPSLSGSNEVVIFLGQRPSETINLQQVDLMLQIDGPPGSSFAESATNPVAGKRISLRCPPGSTRTLVLHLREGVLANVRVAIGDLIQSDVLYVMTVALDDASAHQIVLGDRISFNLKSASGGQMGTVAIERQ
jgi:hypothetical protein